jgi:hypothetical protein
MQVVGLLRDWGFVDARVQAIPAWVVVATTTRSLGRLPPGAGCFVRSGRPPG